MLQTSKIRANFCPTAREFAPRPLIMLKYGANILHYCSCSSAPLHGLNPKAHGYIMAYMHFVRRFCLLFGLLFPLPFGELLWARQITLRHHFPAKFQPNNKAGQGFERVSLDVFALDGARIKVGRTHARQQENED